VFVAEDAVQNSAAGEPEDGEILRIDGDA